MCIIAPNFIKMGQKVSDTERFNIFFKMAAVRHLGFVGALGGLYCCSKMVEIHAVVLLF